MPFTTRGLPVDLHDDRGTLIAPLAYQGRVEHFIVPSGFETDFASVPRLFQCFTPSIGKWTRSAVLHDWFCVHLAAGDCVVSSRDADGIFRRTMRECGVGFVTRWLMWTGVRWGALANPARRGGWWHWRSSVPTVAITALSLAVVAGVAWALDSLAHHLI